MSVAEAAKFWLGPFLDIDNGPDDGDHGGDRQADEHGRSRLFGIGRTRFNRIAFGLWNKPDGDIDDNYPGDEEGKGKVQKRLQLRGCADRESSPVITLDGPGSPPMLSP